VLAPARKKNQATVSKTKGSKGKYNIYYIYSCCAAAALKQKEFAAWYSSSTGKLLLAKPLEHLSQQRISKQAYAPGGTRSKLHILRVQEAGATGGRYTYHCFFFNGEARSWNTPKSIYRRKLATGGTHYVKKKNVLYVYNTQVQNYFAAEGAWFFFKIFEPLVFPLLLVFSLL
jgi:hypothetical protein